MDEHARFGGVVPEIAARAHLEAMVPMVHQAVATAGVSLSDIDAVAVTAGPGLATAVQVGVAAAKAYALALGVPLYGVHHLAGHAAVDVLEHGPMPAELRGADRLRRTHLAAAAWGPGPRRRSCTSATPSMMPPARPSTRWPGCSDCPIRAGPSSTGSPARATRRDRLPSPDDRPERPGAGFSFSGLKTAVARWVERHDGPVPVPDIAASFQEAVADTLTRKALLACAEHGVDTLLMVGGVAANSRIRALAEQRCAGPGSTCGCPPLRLCTDNGAMIAASATCWSAQVWSPTRSTSPPTRGRAWRGRCCTGCVRVSGDTCPC